MSRCATEGCKKQAIVCGDCLDKMDEDMRLMLWALGSRWMTFYYEYKYTGGYHCGHCGENHFHNNGESLWRWSCFSRVTPLCYTVLATQSKLPELNDELREILKKERDNVGKRILNGKHTRTKRQT